MIAYVPDNSMLIAVSWVIIAIMVVPAALTAFFSSRRGRDVWQRFRPKLPVSFIPRSVPPRSRMLLWTATIWLFGLALLFPPRKQVGWEHTVVQGHEKPVVTRIERIPYLPLAQFTEPPAIRDLLPDSMRAVFLSKDGAAFRDSVWRSFVISRTPQPVVVWGWSYPHLLLLLLELAVILIVSKVVGIILKRRVKVS